MLAFVTRSTSAKFVRPRIWDTEAGDHGSIVTFCAVSPSLPLVSRIPFLRERGVAMAVPFTRRYSKRAQSDPWISDRIRRYFFDNRRCTVTASSPDPGRSPLGALVGIGVPVATHLFFYLQLWRDLEIWAEGYQEYGRQHDLI